MRTSILLALAAVVGCGGNSTKHLADAPKSDAPKSIDSKDIDAAPDAAPTGTVSIAVDNNGSAVVGATVYFQDADSTVVSNTVTGSDGTASATIAEGGFVTVIEPEPADSEQFLDTFSGVKPNDKLTLE